MQERKPRKIQIQGILRKDELWLTIYTLCRACMPFVMFDSIFGSEVKGKNRKRYSMSMKMFYEVVLIWGGPHLANFMAKNLRGPEIHSTYRWRKEHTLIFKSEMSVDNCTMLINFYTNVYGFTCRNGIIVLGSLGYHGTHIIFH